MSVSRNRNKISTKSSIFIVDFKKDKKVAFNETHQLLALIKHL